MIIASNAIPNVKWEKFGDIYIYILITIKVSKMTKVTSQVFYKKEYRD